MRPGELYENLLPATIAGDRRKMQVFCVETDTGGAGMAVDRSDVDEGIRILRDTNESHSRMLDQMATAVAIFDKSQKLVFHNNSFFTILDGISGTRSLHGWNLVPLQGIVTLSPYQLDKFVKL